MNALNETHDPRWRSWVASAQDRDTDFPLQNLPFAVFRRRGSQASFRGGVAIGDQVLDLAALQASGALSADAAAAEACAAAAQSNLNAFMAQGASAWSALRLALSRGLREGAAQQALWARCLVAQSDVEFGLPAAIGDYTDFYTSIHHATNIGRQFRPDQPLLPNYVWVPIGYHGRVSSLGVSGQSFARPSGQIKRVDQAAPVVGPCERLDYELELGLFVGPGNAQGEPIELADAEGHLFGVCLLNDWSARDVQAWEYQPLGPFLSKNFATTLSPWIVTLEALAPFRAPLSRAAADPAPLPYLDSDLNRSQGALDIQLAVSLLTATMRQQGDKPARLSQTSYRHAYWTPAQLITHHTMNGCNLRAGDLLGSGTLSGPSLPEAGALIELTVGGKQPIKLPNGEQRTYLQDGDCVQFRGWCEADGATRIGFGLCEGTVLPARPARVA